MFKEGKNGENISSNIKAYLQQILLAQNGRATIILIFFNNMYQLGTGKRKIYKLSEIYGSWM